MDQAVVLIDSTGRPGGTLGRSGNGPGEFRRPVSVGFTGDSVWVIDNALRRVSVFGPTGRSATTLPFASILGRGGEPDSTTPNRIRARLAGGQLLLERVNLVAPRFDSRSQVTHLFISDGNGGTPVKVLDLLTSDAYLSIRYSAEFAPVQWPNPAQRKDLVAWDSEGRRIVTLTYQHLASASDVIVRAFDPKGTLVFTRNLHLPVLPFDEQMVRRDAMAFGATLIPDPATLERVVSDVIASVKAADGQGKSQPAAVGLVVSSDSSIWIRVPTRDGHNEWVVLSGADGSDLGKVTLPAPSKRLLAATAGAIWTLELDPAIDAWTTVARYDLANRPRSPR